MPTDRPYNVVIERSAQRQLGKLPVDAQRRIASRINGLAHDPRPPGIKKLRGDPAGALRLRVGDYRVLYRVEDEAVRVLVIRIGHRRDIYDR